MSLSGIQNVACVGCLLILGAICGLPAAAQEVPEEYFELLRQDLRSLKADIVDQVLDLSEANSEAFWPIYREYEKELNTFNDRRLAAIERFMDTEGVIDDDEASGFAKDFFALQTDKVKLLKTYYKKVEKATSPLIAARFVQVENLLGKMTDLQIATELPLIR